MKPEIKKRWIEALRSGEYKQGLAKLKSINPNNGEEYYCCLGVLCDLYRKEKDVFWKMTGDEFYYLSNSNGNATSLPIEVQEWAGLMENDPALNCENTCIDLNDLKKLNFNQIADAIDESTLI